MRLVMEEKTLCLRGICWWAAGAGAVVWRVGRIGKVAGGVEQKEKEQLQEVGNRYPKASLENLHEDGEVEWRWVRY